MKDNLDNSTVEMGLTPAKGRPKARLTEDNVLDVLGHLRRHQDVCFREEKDYLTESHHDALDYLHLDYYRRKLEKLKRDAHENVEKLSSGWEYTSTKESIQRGERLATRWPEWLEERRIWLIENIEPELLQKAFNAARQARYKRRRRRVTIKLDSSIHHYLKQFRDEHGIKNIDLALFRLLLEAKAIPDWDYDALCKRLGS